MTTMKLHKNYKKFQFTTCFEKKEIMIKIYFIFILYDLFKNCNTSYNNKLDNYRPQKWLIISGFVVNLLWRFPSVYTQIQIQTR